MKTVLITGGSKGIGLETVLRFHKLGCQIVTCGRSQDTWDSVIKLTPDLASVDFRPVDLAIDENVVNFFDYIRKNYTGIDYAINNASSKIKSSGSFKDVSLEDLSDTLKIDFWAQALCIRHELPLMKANSCIVNVTSINGFKPSPNYAMYSASKHALEGLTRSLALEAIKQDIRINSVAPGPTWTPRWEEREKSNQNIRAEIEKLIPSGEFAEPEDVVNAIEWLCSDKANFVVGHTLVVDGGLSLI